MMTRKIGLSTAMFLWAGLAATSVSAQEAAQPCVTVAEAAGLMLYVAPEAIKASGLACASILPANALLRQTGGPFIEKFEAEAQSAWPMAKAAIAKIAGDDVRPLLDTDAFRPLMTAMMAPLITKGIKTQDCAAIDRILTLLAPLPPRNAADLVVTILELQQAKGSKSGKKSPITICQPANN